MDSAGQPSGKAPGQSCSERVSTEEPLAMMHISPGFFKSQKSRADLYALGTEGKRGDHSASIGDPSGGNHGDRDGVYDLRDKGERPREGRLGGAQKRTTMTTGFEAGCSDDVDSCLLKDNGFIRRRRCPDGEDSLGTAFVENFLRRNSVDETEGGNVGREGRERAAHGLNVPRKEGQASREGLAAGSVRTFILHRDPQVHGKRFGSERSNLGDDVFDCCRSPAMRSKGAEAAKIRNGRCQPLC